jgi:hypothetical protein
VAGRRRRDRERDQLRATCRRPPPAARSEPEAGRDPERSARSGRRRWLSRCLWRTCTRRAASARRPRALLLVGRSEGHRCPLRGCGSPNPSRAPPARSRGRVMCKLASSRGCPFRRERRQRAPRRQRRDIHWRAVVPTDDAAGQQGVNHGKPERPGRSEPLWLNNAVWTAFPSCQEIKTSSSLSAVIGIQRCRPSRSRSAATTGRLRAHTRLSLWTGRTPTGLPSRS